MRRSSNLVVNGQPGDLATPDVKEYPRARHGFIDRITAVSSLAPFLKIIGIGHDHDAAADAKRRILSFFETHLRARADDQH